MHVKCILISITCLNIDVKLIISQFTSLKAVFEIILFRHKAKSKFLVRNFIAQSCHRKHLITQAIAKNRVRIIKLEERVHVEKANYYIPLELPARILGFRVIIYIYFQT